MKTGYTHTSLYILKQMRHLGSEIVIHIVDGFLSLALGSYERSILFNRLANQEQLFSINR